MLTVPEAEYPFRNLVFQGGGMKMFAYHGALQVLEEAGILARIERVAGASSGSLTAMLVSLRLSVAETIELFQQFDYSRIPEANGSSIEEDPDEGDPGHRAVPSSAAAETAPASDEAQEGSPEDSRPLWEQLTTGEWAQNFQGVVGNLKAVMRLVNQHGWYANRNLYRWTGDIIADHLGDRRATFRDFQRADRRNLYVVATNLSRQRTEVFSVDTTPDVAVVDALLLSQSIPLYFEAPRFDGLQLGQGDYYTDGGVLDNYPLQLFDEPRHAYDRANFVDGINRETLGCRLFTPPDCQEPAEIRTLVDYVVNLFLTMNAAEDIAYANNPTAQKRTVEISNCCVASTDFDLRPHPDDPRYRDLTEAGSTAMRRYLADYAS
jgi:NTE family protein